jgi:hypothetical protein
MKKLAEKLPSWSARRPKFARVLAGVLGSFGITCASSPVLVRPTIPPCPGYSWALLEEVELVCARNEEPFHYCPALYDYLEDVARYCEEIQALRGN